ncbi:MAG: hypothetical protein ACREPM_09170 [Gemmatimonadaceae bacterium]
MPIRIASLAARVGIASLTLAAAAGAQLPLGFVRVTAKDSTGTPVPGAELVVTKGMKSVVGSGVTDSLGGSLIAVHISDSTDLQVTMRKIGYRRGDHFFAVGPHDTAHVSIVVGRPLQALAAVKITEEASLKFKSYYLDADQIEAANLNVADNAWDVIKTLRPDMLTSRGGCGTGVREVWVNGKWIRLTLLPTPMERQRARVGAPINARFGYVPLVVLSEIAPEHIQSMTYHDCFDTSVGTVGSNNALFIVLKPGVEYVQDVGSFVVDQPETAQRPH